MPHSCPRVYQALMSAAWAIDPVKARALRGFAVRALKGEALSEQDRAAMRVGQGRSGAAVETQPSIAVVPIVGTIVHRAEQADDVSEPGAVSAARLRAQMRALASDETIASVILDIESPGGAVDGIEELALEVRRLAEIKPVAAVANAYAASAAYWIASQAGEVVVTPSGDVGSIGVYSLHEDDTAMLNDLGVKISVIRAGRHKIETNPFEPLSEEGRAEMQAMVDRHYDAFTAAVARGRGLSVRELRSQPWGQGRMVGARRAVEVGLADRIETIEQTMARLAAGKGVVRKTRRRAEAAKIGLGLS